MKKWKFYGKLLLVLALLIFNLLVDFKTEDVFVKSYIVLIGAFANLFVIYFNGLKMPVYTYEREVKNYETENHKFLNQKEEIRMFWLADIFALILPFKKKTHPMLAFSI